MDNIKKIDINISFLRIFATLGVLFLHTCSTVYDNSDLFTITSSQENFLFVCVKLFCCAVPLFFMISGKLLLGSKIEFTYHIILKKYVFRIFLALLLFGLVFCTIKVYIETKQLSVLVILKAFVGNEGFAHLWYLYTLIGVYMVLPIIKPAIQKLDRKNTTIFLVLLFVFDFCMPAISSLSGWNIAFDISLTYPIFYLTAGYFFEQNESSAKQNEQKHRRRNILVSTTVIIVFIVLMFVLYRWQNYFDMIFAYQSPVTAIYALAVYYLFKQIHFPSIPEHKIKLLWNIDRLCFGVYLVHPVFIQFTYRIINITPCSFDLFPLATFVFFGIFAALSFMLSWIMNSIPILRKYIL